MSNPTQAPVRGIIELRVVEFLDLRSGYVFGVVVVPMDPNYGPESHAVIRFNQGRRIGGYVEATITSAAAIDDVTKRQRPLGLRGRRCRLKDLP